MAVGEAIPGTYLRRWAPYGRGHSQAQGQLPRESYRPQGIVSARTGQPAAAYVGPREAEIQAEEKFRCGPAK
jgi:hypothetical protein